MITTTVVMPNFIKACIGGRRRIQDSGAQALLGFSPTIDDVSVSSFATTGIKLRVSDAYEGGNLTVRVFVGGPIVFSSVSLTEGLTYWVNVRVPHTGNVPYGSINPLFLCAMSFVADANYVSKPLAIVLPNNLLLEI